MLEGCLSSRIRIIGSIIIEWSLWCWILTVESRILRIPFCFPPIDCVLISTNNWRWCMAMPWQLVSFLYQVYIIICSLISQIMKLLLINIFKCYKLIKRQACSCLVIYFHRHYYCSRWAFIPVRLFIDSFHGCIFKIRVSLHDHLGDIILALRFTDQNGSLCRRITRGEVPDHICHVFVVRHKGTTSTLRKWASFAARGRIPTMVLVTRVSC